MKYRNVPFNPPDMTEAEAKAASEAILSGWITTGPRVKKLESLLADYVGIPSSNTESGKRHPNCVCLSSQTACGEMALRILGVGPGDEVIVPAYTYTASASVITHVGANIVFVDVQKPTGRKDDFRLEMDYDKMANAINERTKVIIPVDLAGIPCDYDRIYEIVNAKKHLFRPENDIQAILGRIAVCADSAHALGTEWHGRKVGSIADFSSFSFHAVKNFTTGEGGALTWNLPFGNQILPRQQVYHNAPVTMEENEIWDDFIYRIAQLFSLHGQNKDAYTKTQLGRWEYDIIGTWYKSNMTDIAAAIGLSQLQRYPDMLVRRHSIIDRYNNAFSNLPVALLRHRTDEYTSSGHLYLVRLLGRTRQQTDLVIQRMAERGIACNVHYKPLPMMTAYRNLGFDIKDFPNSYALFENEITLPLNSRMSDDDVDYVIANFKDIVGG